VVIRPAAGVLAAALVLAVPAAARAARTDVVILKNGDRFTGEVVQMRQGKLQVKTDDAGTLSVEWDKIASLSTADLYDIVLQDGAHRFGRFRPAPAPGTVLVVPDGGSGSPVLMADIASVARIKLKFQQRIDGSVDLGASYSKSSGVADLWFNATAKYRRPAYGLAATFSTQATHQQEVENTSRYSLRTAYTRYRGSNWLLSTTGLFEGNRDLGFTFRGTAMESIGRYLARTRHAEFLLGGGFAAGREVPVDAGAVTNLDGLVAMELSIFTYDFPTTRIDFTTLVFPSFDDPGRVRVNADGKFVRELFKDFIVSFTVYDAYDNRPKSGTAQLNDLGGSLSFGWTF
jgi:hypothetical protein